MRREEDTLRRNAKVSGYVSSGVHSTSREDRGRKEAFGVKLPSFLENLDPNIFWSDNYVVLDWETTNLDKGFAGNQANKIVLGTWVLGPTHPARRRLLPQTSRSGVHYKLGNEFEQTELVRAVQEADFIVAHFAKFELQWLSRAGVDLSRVLAWDTVLGEYVLAGNRRRANDLHSTALRRKLGTGKESLVSSLIEGGVCPSEIPEQWLIEYGCKDTWLAWQIFLQQRQELTTSHLLPVMYTRCLTTPILADMELNGLQLDAERVKREYEHARADLSRCSEDLLRQTGGINLNSPKQVASYVYDVLGFEELTYAGKPSRTESGKKRTDAETILRLVAKTPEQHKFAEAFARYSKIEYRANVLEKLQACCDEKNGILYASINQAVTQTHRLASSGKEYKVQIQNIAREFKKLFKARHPDWLVGEADGAQLEFRVAAHLGRDPIALADIRNPKFDAHYQTAEIIYKTVRELISKEQRSDVKPHTFKPLYGGMSGTPEEKAYYRFFQEKYNGIYRVQEGWSYDVLRDKKLTTEWGLIFYWPDTKLEVGPKGGKGYIKNRTSIFNYPVQSLATAEIIPIALVYTWHYFKALGLEGFLVNTVHDSVIAELPPAEEDIFRDITEYTFTECVFRYLVRVYNIRFTVPLGSESKVGTHWSEGKERKYDLDPDEYFMQAA